MKLKIAGKDVFQMLDEYQHMHIFGALLEVRMVFQKLEEHGIMVNRITHGTFDFASEEDKNMAIIHFQN